MTINGWLMVDVVVFGGTAMVDDKGLLWLMVYGYNDNVKILDYSQEWMMICTKTNKDHGCGYNDHVIYLAVAMIMVVSMVDNVENGYLKTTMSPRYISGCSNDCDHCRINIIND